MTHTWYRSSYSANTDNCVEVALGNEAVRIRDTKDPEGGMLMLPTAGWSAFVANVRSDG